MLLNDIKSERPQLDEFIVSHIIDKYCVKQGEIDSNSNAYFSQYWQGYAWVAILGFVNNRRSKLAGKKDNKFNMQVISNQNNDIFNLLILLAISESSNGFEIVDDPKAIVEIISEYARGGAEYVVEIRSTPGKESFFNNPSDFIDEIVDRKVKN